MLRVVRLAGRVSLSSIFVYSGIDLIRHPEGRAKRAADALPGLPDLPLLGQVHGATMAGAGASLALGVLPAASAVVLLLTMVPNTYIGHAFWKLDDPQERKTQRLQFLKNVGIAGGLLSLVADERYWKRR